MKALVIPADEALGVREVQIPGQDSDGTLESLQVLVGGFIETIPHPTRSDVAPYFNEEGKLLGLPANRRATRLLQESIRPDDYIAGDCVFAGFDPASGRTVELPADFEVSVIAPRQLGKPDAIVRRDRSITCDWLLGESPDGRRRLATLTITHCRAGVNMLSGERHPNEFTATLANETEEPASCGGVMRGFRLFSGIRIERETIGRFSAKGMEAFAERALARLGELCAAGDERVLRYFASDTATSAASS
jgi:Domain of unknown function (DUF3846)